MKTTLIVILLTLALLAQTNTFAAIKGSQQGSSSLTLAQIEDLIGVPTPDSTIASEIDRLAVTFIVDDEVIQKLRKLGAGPLTLAALARVGNKALKTTILVADFRGVNNENVGMSQLLIQQLRDALAPYPDVEVQPLGKAITSEQGSDVALKEGRDRGATIVIWGWFVESPVVGLVNAHIENLRPSYNYNLASGREEYRVSLQEFNQFTIQSRLSKDFTTITLAATAVARLDSGDYKTAIAQLNEAIRIGVTEPNLIGAADLYTLRALANLDAANLNQADTTQQAIDDCEQAIKLNGKMLDAYLVRAYAYLVQKSSDQALAEGKRLLEMFDNPFNRVSIYNLILQALDQQSNIVADRNVEQVRAYSKEVLATTDNLTYPTPATFFQRAYSFSRLGNETDALADLTKALELKPKGQNAIRIHFFRGSLLEGRGEYTEALKEFREVISIDPKATDAYVQIGHILYWKKDYAPSIQSYTAAIKLAPKDGIQYSNRGRVYQDSGDLKNASIDYDKSIELTPTNDSSYFNRATLRSAQKQVKEAIRDLNKCLELTPNYREALDWRADINFQQAAYDASIEDYTRVIEVDRNDAHAFLYRGISKSRKANIEGALDDYNQSIKLAPDYAEAYLERGLLYATRSSRKEAIEDLTQAFRSASDSDTRQQAQQQLIKLGVRTPIQRK